MKAFKKARFHDPGADLGGANIMPANTAWVGVAPNASTMRGRWAAIAEVTVQAAAKANDNRTIVLSIGMYGLTVGPSAVGRISARGSERLSGRPIAMWASAHA
jgi:hypothetical protein